MRDDYEILELQDFTAAECQVFVKIGLKIFYNSQLIRNFAPDC